MSLKNERIAVQVTPEQKAAIQDAAAAVGLTMSGYLLFSAFEKMGEQLGQNILDIIESKKKQSSEP